MNAKELSEFLRMLSHDLQNQIGSVDLNLQILPTFLDPNSETSREISPFVTRAALSTSEMVETLGDLQRFAYSIGGSTEHVITEHELATLLRDSLLNLTPKAQARGLEIVLGSTTEGTVRAEREAVLSAIRLFAGEAIRSSFPGSSISLSTSKSEDSRFSILIHASQAGLFESHRPNLSMFLAQEALKPSKIEVQFFTGDSRSAVRLVFPL